MRKSLLALILVCLYAATGNAVDKPMHPAVAQLDLDGDMVLYLNTSTIEQRVLNYIDRMASIILSTRATSASEPELEAIKAGVDKVKNVVRWSGLLSLDSYAMSTAPIDGTFCRTVSVASYSEDDADRPLWRLLASEPRILKGIRYVPADAVYTVNGTTSLDEAWNIVNEAVTNFFEPPQIASFNQQTAMIGMILGTNITAMTRSLGNEILFSIQLSEEKQCVVPMGTQTVTIPEPNLIIGLQTEDPLVGQIILKELQASRAPMTNTVYKGFTLYTLNVPTSTPFPVTPTLVQTDDYLLVGSSETAIVKALDSQAKGNGLTTTPLYEKLLADAPEKTSSIDFLSPRFMQVYMTVMKQAFSTTQSSEEQTMIDIMLGGYANMYSGGYTLKTPTSLYSRCYADYGGAKPVEMVATAYIGMIAAIAIPSFEKARSSSMDKVCENNLRIIKAATEEWALENNKQDDALVSEADISEFIKGGFSALACPKGGTYTIHPVGTPPSCSFHGSLQ